MASKKKRVKKKVDVRKRRTKLLKERQKEHPSQDFQLDN